MEYILYFFRFLYRIRWWLLIGTAIVTLLVILATKNMAKTYNVEATLYTGVVSGYTIEGSGITDWAATNNAIDNLINIIRAESTLKRVSHRLYARNMINGNPDKDNSVLTAASFREIYNRTKNNKDGKTLLALIDKSSEAETVKNMGRYEKQDRDNFIYGLFYYQHVHYSYEALKKIQVTRKGNSDLLQISYSSNDPGIAYNTMTILMDEFVDEYRNIRYGETDKVIEYFRSELERIGLELKGNEDDLTTYNVEKRVINYYDETKEIAAINKEFELREQNILLAYNGSRAMLEELEKQLEANLYQLRTNAQFVNSLNKVSSLTGKISELESFSTNETNHDIQELEDYREQLKEANNSLLELSDQYVSNLHTKEGIAKTTIIEQWLEQMLLFEQAKSQLEIIQKSKQDLLDKYTFYAPVGSEIKRKERKISFTEQNYIAVLRSYNDALMRRKNLEMTSATLKVINHPAFPINSAPTGRRKIIMIAFVASLLFIFGIFLLIEILDRTLRDRLRTERVTGMKVLGAFPNKLRLKYRNYNKAFTTISTKYLSSAILSFFTNKDKDRPYIVNFLSTEPGDGKSYLSDNLEDYWRSLGMNVRKLSWESDFDINDRQYLLAKNLKDIFLYKDEDIIIVEYPNLGEYSIPNELMEEADLNLLVARANRAWKDSDKLIYEKLKKQVGKSPLYFYLNKTSREVTENFTGMLPPYTYLRRLGYRFSQLGLTEEMNKGRGSE